MGDTYCYSDINEIIQQLTALYQITEQAMDDMIAAGTSLSGCEGQAADAFRARFSSDYTALKGELVACRENAFQKITQLYDGFTAIDSSTNAVISISQLTANNNFLNESTGRIISEAESYNQILQSIAHIPVSCQRVDVFEIDAQKNDITHFLTNLGMRLLETDSEASAAIRESFADYQSFIAKTLTFFDVDVQAALLVNLHGALPLHVYDGIVQKLGHENDLLELSAALYAQKETLMEENNLKTDKEFDALVKRELELLALWQEYDPVMQTFFLETSADEQYRYKKLHNSRTPYSDYLFLADNCMKDFTPEERQKILALYDKKKGDVSLADINRILPKDRQTNQTFKTALDINYTTTQKHLGFTEVTYMAGAEGVNKILGNIQMMHNPYPMTYQYPDALADDEKIVGKGSKESYKVPANTETFNNTGKYSGELVKVDKPDRAADELAKRIGGDSRVKYANDPQGREFDVVSDKYIAQAKPDLKGYGKSWRKQTKATFEAAIETGKKPYFQFEGTPDDAIIRRIQEYSDRYGIDYVIDTNPLGVTN